MSTSLGGTNPYVAILGAGLNVASSYMSAKSKQKGLQASYDKLSPYVSGLGEQSDEFYDIMRDYLPGGKMGRAVRGDQINALAGSVQGLTPSQRRAGINQLYSKTLQSIPSTYASLGQTAQGFGEIGRDLQLKEYEGGEQLASLIGAKKSINPTVEALGSLGATAMTLMQEGGKVYHSKKKPKKDDDVIIKPYSKYKAFSDWANPILEKQGFTKENYPDFKHANDAIEIAMGVNSRINGNLKHPMQEFQGNGGIYSDGFQQGKSEFINRSINETPFLPSGTAGGSGYYDSMRGVHNYGTYGDEMSYDETFDPLIKGIPLVDGVEVIYKRKKQKGGEVRGPHHASGGVNAGNNIELQGGEYVVNATSANKNKALLDMINSDNNEVTMMDGIFGEKHSRYQGRPISGLTGDQARYIRDEMAEINKFAKTYSEHETGGTYQEEYDALAEMVNNEAKRLAASNAMPYNKYRVRDEERQRLQDIETEKWYRKKGLYEQYALKDDINRVSSKPAINKALERLFSK